MNDNAIGKNIKRLRIEQGWTQEELAFRLGTSQPKISDLEAGQHNPRMDTLRKLAEVFGVDAGSLLQ